MTSRDRSEREVGRLRGRYFAAWIAGCLFWCLLLPTAAPGDEEVPRPEKRGRLDLPARRPGESGFTKETRRVPVEVFLDPKSNCLVYMVEGGKGLAVVPADRTGREQRGKPPTWLYRLTLPVRSWGEKDLGDSTSKVGLEVYRDEANDSLIYVSHTGSLAVLRGPVVPADKRDKEPRWLARLPLTVRPSGENDRRGFSRCNVEVYHDRSANHVVYVSEKGTLGVLPEKASPQDKEESQPVLSHGLILKARTYEENSFENATSFGVEVYRDEKRSAWIYLTEAFHLAVVPGGKPAELKRLKSPEYERAVMPRPAAGSKWSAEVFLNRNNGHKLFAMASGSLAVLAGPPQKD